MTADDVAGVALYLAADAPPALTGACIDVFG
jgi:putative cofactor-binding repeat protein